MFITRLSYILAFLALGARLVLSASIPQPQHNTGYLGLSQDRDYMLVEVEVEAWIENGE